MLKPTIKVVMPKQDEEHLDTIDLLDIEGQIEEN